MNKNTENIDSYLKGIVPPEHASDQHRQQLRREIHTEIERRRTMSVKIRSWKYAAMIALLAVAAVAVGAEICRWHFIGKDSQMGYLLESEDGRFVTNIPDSWADNAELAVKVKEELDLQNQRGDRKLVAVVEKEVNGQLDSRFLIYEHSLSDGRVVKDGEYDPDESNPRTLTKEQQGEMDRLWHEQLKQEDSLHELHTVEERQVKNCVFSFRKWRLVLGDGTEVIYSIGHPKKD
jgi:hypothetical protein